MSTKRTKINPHYRPILLSALHHVLTKRDVWFFGIFAFFLGSGSAIETVMRARNGLEAFDAPLLTRIFPALESVRQWMDQLPALSPERAAVSITIVVLLAAALLTAAALSQGALIHENKTRRKTLRGRELLAHARKHFWSILGVGLILQIAFAISLLILLTPGVSQTPFLVDLLIMLQVLIGYGFMLASSIVAVYALIAMVNHDASFTQGIKEGWRVFHTHPAASMEAAVILFFLNLLVGIGLLLLLLLLALPYTLFFLLGAAAGSLLATTLITTITFILTLALILILGGTTTAYNYAVLVRVYERLRVGRFKSKLHRIQSTGHWF